MYTGKKSRKKNFEIKFYECILKERPDFTEALVALGDVYTKKKFYKEGLDIDKRLVMLKPSDPIIRYNLACSLSLVGRAEEALKELGKAVLLGYKDFPYILKDSDLENLRNLPGFEEFFSGLEKCSSSRGL